MTGAYPDDNPKTAIGAKKVPLHLVPPSANHYFAMAMADGAAKYGPYNWRDKAVTVSTYIAAAKRHMDAYWDGEDVASDSGVHHLGHAMACMGIVIDAMTIGKLRDDRPTKGAAPALQAAYTNKEVVENDPSIIRYGGPNPASEVGIRVRDIAEGYDKFDPFAPRVPNCS